MTDTKYNIWQEIMKLIAEYDWAVEGANAPADSKLTRQEATTIRNGLVKLAGELCQ